MIDGGPCHDTNTVVLKRYRSPHNTDIDKTVHKTLVVHITNLNHFEHELFCSTVLPEPNNQSSRISVRMRMNLQYKLRYPAPATSKGWRVS
jgi:hypothetical protein